MTMTDITPSAIAALKDAAEKATPGPWKQHLVDETTIVSQSGVEVACTCPEREVERYDSYNVEYERMEADARFIALARNAVPALLSENERLRKERDDLQAKLDAANADCVTFRTAKNRAEERADHLQATALAALEQKP